MEYGTSRGPERRRSAFGWGLLLVLAVCALGGVIVPSGVQAQEEWIFTEVDACVDPERGPNHEDCVCSVLVVQDSDYYHDYRARLGRSPKEYPSGLRYEGDDDPLVSEVVRDKEFKSQCAMTYYNEDLRRSWKFGVFVAFGLFTMSLVWGGYVYMQESAAAEQRATSRAIIFRVMAGLAIVVMAYFIWTMFSQMFLDLGDKVLWSPEYEQPLRRPDW